MIRRIYETAVDPQSYSDFMSLWEEYLSRALDDAPSGTQQDGAEDVAQALGQHFETAFRIIEEQGRAPQHVLFAEDQPSARPGLLMDARGQIVWSNRAAAQGLGLGARPGLDDLRLDEDTRALLTAMLADLQQGRRNRADSDQQLIRVGRPDGAGFVVLVASARQEPNGERLLLLEDIHRQWPDGGRRLLADFGLSEAEKDIAALIFEGHDTGSMAELRQSSPATVRTQVKRLMAKTGQGSQASLNRFLAALARVAEAQDDTRRLKDPEPYEVVLNGRRLPYYLFGPPKGRPVIFFHGMLDGCLLPDRLVRLLFRHRLRVIAPVRPGFGSAAGEPQDKATGEVGPDVGATRTAPTRFAKDVLALADHLKLGRVVLLGHMGGAPYAHEAARVFGARALGVVHVAGGVPILTARQFAEMSPRQKVVAHTARYAPALLKFVLRAGIRQIDHGGIRQFIQALYAEGSPDQQLLQDVEIYESLRQGYHFSVAQGHHGFEADSYHMVRNWDHRVRAHDLPIHLLHGAQDPVVSPASVRAFADGHAGRTTLDMLEGVGQLLLYARPDVLAQVLADMHGTGGLRKVGATHRPAAI